MKQPSNRRQRGVTLIESMVALTVMAVTVGAVAPSFSQAQERRRLEGTASQMETELQYARSLAVARNQTVRFSFQASAASTCYVIHTGSANACQCASGTAVCTAGAQAIRSVRFDADSHVRATSNATSFLFDPIKGTVTPTATIELRNTAGNAVRLVVNIMGRVRACTPSGLTGYRAC